MRNLIIHYHFFKNAGTSIDELLSANFGQRWAKQEFPKRGNAEAIAEFIQRRPEIEALSSHTALFPTPRIDGVAVFPIVFIRHPIDRLRSAYEFERGQVADTKGAHLAKQNDFAGYVRELVGSRTRLARNFQTYRLSLQAPQGGSERDRAMRTLTGLPFVGLVEAFDTSISRLELALRPLCPSIRPLRRHLNATHKVAGLSLAEKLTLVRRQLGPSLFQTLWDANQDDLFIHAHISSLYGTSPLHRPPGGSRLGHYAS